MASDDIRTVYVAGPMSGVDEWNYPAFDAVSNRLRSVGYAVVNPADHFDRDTTRPRAAYIRQSLHDVEDVDALALLPGWERSEGARLEFEYARQLGISAYNWWNLYFYELAEPITSVPDASDQTPRLRGKSLTMLQHYYPELATWHGPVIKQPNEWAAEREDILTRFREELAKATGDGSRKRQAGEKPPWYRDDAHEGAIFSHLTKWKRGQVIDPDSGAHTLVHLAWRALAIACQETGNVPEEANGS